MLMARPMAKERGKRARAMAAIKRLRRCTLCFANAATMHDLVIGVFINRYEFGGAI
jgi:insertion element IS1 protein InsB